MKIKCAGCKAIGVKFYTHGKKSKAKKSINHSNNCPSLKGNYSPRKRKKNGD